MTTVLGSYSQDHSQESGEDNLKNIVKKATNCAIKKKLLKVRILRDFGR